MISIRQSSLVWLTALYMGLCGLASAQVPWPKAKPITIVVPYSAGGSLDGTGRLVAQHLATRLGQSVAVENVTGAGGGIGIGKVISAPADGYTFLLAGDAPLVPGAPGETRYRYDMLRETAPIALVNTAPMLIVAHPSMPFQNFSEFLSYAKSNPGRLNYASSGIGTLPHLAMEMVKARGQLHVVHIPYRGGTQIANDVAGKQIEMAMLITASALPAVKGNLIKPLAVTGDSRLASLPQVPTVAETPAFRNFNVVSWSGLYAPAGVPAEIQTRMAHEVSEVLKMDVVRSKLMEQSALPQGGTPAQFAAFIERDRAQLSGILKVLSLKE